MSDVSISYTGFYNKTISELFINNSAKYTLQVMLRALVFQSDGSLGEDRLEMIKQPYVMYEGGKDMKKRQVALALAAVMAVGSVAGCSGSSDTKTTTAAAAETTTAAPAERVKLTICAPDNTFGKSTDPDMQQAVIDMLEEKANVDLEAVIPPISSYNDKLETMMAGGDVPDIFSISQDKTPKLRRERAGYAFG